MSQVMQQKKRLINKKTELHETWTDISVLISQYLEKLNFVVDTVLREKDSVSFFQTYPKVSSHVDKILNIFLQVQCEFSLLSCEKFLDSEVCNLHCSTKTEGLPVEERCITVSDSEDLSQVKVGVPEKLSNPTEEDRSTELSNSEDVSVTKVSALGQEVCDSSVEVCTTAESVERVENSSPYAVNVSDTEKITESVAHVSSVETLPVCKISEDLRSESSGFTSAKKRISQYDIKPNEVLEMVYSHGDNPWNFWLCYYPCSDIKFIQKSVSSMYYTNRLEALSILPDVGDYVLVADGERFLRGKVLTVRGTELLDTTCVMLLDVDSGRMKSFKLQSVWKITEELMCIQAQAVNCQLEGIAGDSSMWCKENLRQCQMDRKFEELLLQTTLSVKFIKTIGDSALPRYIIDADSIDMETDKIYNVSQLINSTIIPAITRKPVVEEYSQESEASVLQNSTAVTSVSHDCHAKNVVLNVPQEVANDPDEISEKITSQASDLSTGCMAGVGNAQQIYENCIDGIYEYPNSPRSHCEPSSQTLLLHETDTNLNSEKVTHDAVEICEKIVFHTCELRADSRVDIENSQELCENGIGGINQKLNSPNFHCIPSIEIPPYSEIDKNLNSQKLSDSDIAEIISLCETSSSDVIIDVEDTIDSHTGENIAQASSFGAAELLSAESGEDRTSVTATIYCSKDFILEKRNYSYLLNKTVLGIPTFVDSPSLFYMQIFLNENDEFTDLHEKMAIFYSENKIKFTTKESAQNIIKSYCVALYPQDTQWYRAEIIDWMPATETTVCVSFVDIGDKMVVELDFVQPLARQFAKIPVLSQKCHLYGVAPIECAMYTYVSYEWSPCSLSEFRNVLNLDHVFNMQVKEFTSYGSLGVLLVDPSSPGVSVNKKLIALGEAKCLLNKDTLDMWNPMQEDFERSKVLVYDDEDACEAVAGYSANDEQRFCKFYARHGRCYKGSNCRKEHVLSHPGGWISDKEEVFQEAFSQVVLPEVGETIYLQVTCVIRINLFYIILNVDDNSGEETLLTLNRYINDKDNLKNLRKLKVTPAVGQLVLAHYHQDGIWYRARVIDTDNDNNLVQVFFVDYGNTEWVSEIYVRDIEPQYLHLPFQAIESSLAFTEMNASVDDDSLETVISVFRCLTDCTQPLRAKIISKDDVLKKLELQLFDVNDHDIALMLADTGYVSITSIQMTPATAFAVPG
ncbi:uncharacterized protein LOC124787717 [Schistocerca piceifrons]|uniref:uncharacterized protein LOC124787717 n=1 Tax=Schistocerca piceifrons TaxID=274613 RepID=UPI001F5F2029|nr:uncharacterized protein LOC124787717 [Schistocerca piceifrons]